MPFANLQTQLAAAKQTLANLEADIAAKSEQYEQLKASLPLLESQRDQAQRDLCLVITPEDITTAKQLLDEANTALDDTSTLVSNLNSYIHSANKEPILRQIKELTDQLLNLKYDTIIQELGQLSAEHIELLKDFVVVSQHLRASRNWWGYSMGAAMTEQYGELRGDAFVAHWDKVVAELQL
ncbi:hypothetical protein [Photobacterium nomapromontoriensis]|uniref:hypothetical protein n=1 Tax=Photobacterium nomapromontoriensis TaxID=2910237 RepID=UPI003D09E056